jgi:hypothetical protein
MESSMATVINSGDGNGGGNTFLGFLLGGILVVAAVIGFFMWDNYKSHTGGGAAPAAVVKVEKK